MTMYQAIINVPGYLPESDEDHLFDTIPKAWEWLYDERRRGLDDPMNDEDDADDQALDEMIGMIDHPTTGTVHGRTPGNFGDHDLGLAYSVIEVSGPAHSDYPHDPGHMYDCPACEAECLCTGFPGHVQCVFCALYRRNIKIVDLSAT